MNDNSSEKSAPDDEYLASIKERLRVTQKSDYKSKISRFEDIYSELQQMMNDNS